MTPLELLKKHESLIRATALKHARRFNTSRHVNGPDDLIQIARMAAWDAINAWQEGKKAKLETFMVTCINNRIIDQGRAAARPSRPTLVFLDDDQDFLALTGTDDPTDKLEDDITLKQVLTADEFAVLNHLRTGGGLTELVKSRCRSSYGHTRETRTEVVQCLHRIRHKLQQHGLSLSV